jgi:peptidyl-prolyl cis-trans isomerase SurA
MQAFYEANKKNYMWGQRVNAQVYSAKDDKTLAKLIKVLEKKASKSYTDEQVLAMFNKGEEKNVELINSKIYSADEYAIVDEANETLKFFEVQDLKTPIIFKKELNVVLISEIIPAQTKALNEAKGQITADYQDVLEKKWIAELRSKYPVVVNQNLWSKLRQNP